MSKVLAALPFLMLAADWAEAQEATPQGAAELTALFQTYLGKTPGVVSVVAEGPAYAITLDPGPLFAAIPAEAGVALTATPWALRASDRGDGTWTVRQDQPVRLSFGDDGPVAMTFSADRVVCEGVFDARLPGYVENTCEISNLTFDQTIEDPASGRQVSTQVTERMETRYAGGPGAAGGVDGRLSYREENVRSIFEGPLAPGAAPVTLRVTYPSSFYEGTAKGVRNADFLQALAWLVAHPDEAARQSGRAEIKGILTAGLPLFQEIDVTGTVEDLVVETPIGRFGAAAITVGATIRGAVPEGLYRVALGFEGLALPEGLVPDYARALVPDRMTIDLGVSDYDAAGAAGVLLGLLDLAPDAAPDPAFEGTLLSALLPKGTVDVTLAPGEVANAAYSLRYEGTMTAGPSAIPTGTGKVTATGFEAVATALQAAPQDMKNDILPVIGIARGLARPGEGGTLTWEFDATQPGTLLVNGMDLSGLQ